MLANLEVTLAEPQAWLRDTHSMSASVGLICTTLKELGQTAKNV
jgi:hypothetical protein